MNVDAKIFSKALAIRLNSTLERIVHPDQTAFIKDRYIGDGIRKLQYVIELCNRRKEEGSLVSIDYSKAFDSVRHDYIYTLLNRYNFGPKFIGYIKTLYNGACSSILNIGLSTGYFNLSKSCQQGDALSPYLFVLAIEPLLNKIRNDSSIKGISYLNREFKVSAYADDCTLVLGNKSSILKTLSTFDDFSKISGLKINLDKSEIMGLGSWRDNKRLGDIKL